MIARLLLSAILLPVWGTAAPVPAGEREAGLPYLRNYSPKEYGAQAQNWAVTQDPDGLIYIGNNDGLLLYDGVHWRTIRIANDSAVRSLDVDSKGIVYIGARGDFGYLGADESGSPRYISLLDQVPAEDRGFKDVWRTIVTPDGIVFNSFERLFRYKPGAPMKVWKPASRFYRAFSASDGVYIQEPGAGLLHLDGDGLRPVAGGERFAADRINCLANHEGGLLVGFVDGTFLQRRNSGFEPFPTEAESALKRAQLYSCSALPSGGMAVTTLRGGVLLLSPEGKILRVLNEDAGLSSDSVTSSYTDREGGLWLTLVSGVSRVEARSPLSFFDESTGLTGIVAAIARHEGVLYAGSSAGLFRLRTSSAGEAAQFQQVANVTDAVFSLLSTHAGLLIGDSEGVSVLEGGHLRRVRTSQQVHNLTVSPTDPTLVYAAGVGGLAILRESGNHWTDGGKVPGVGQALRKATAASSVWFGTDFEGAVRMNGPPQSPSIQVFGQKHALPAGEVVPYFVSGRMVFLTKRGILTFDEKNLRFLPDPTLAEPFVGRADQPTLLVEEPESQHIWVGARTYGGVLRHQKDGKYVWDESPLRRMETSEIYSIHLDPDGVAWAGSTDSIVRYNPAIPKNYATPFSARVRRISDIDGKRLYFGGVGAPALTLPYDDNSLRIQFAAPSYDDGTRSEYRVLLDGFDKSWSAWAFETRKDYTNLAEGDYIFRVEARNLFGAVSKQGVYSFSVLPPWHRTWWGYGLRVLAVAALIWMVVRWRLRALAEQNRRLQHTVEERTAELRDKNGELTGANAALNQMNSEKNEFMGIAAHDLKNPLGAIRGYAEMLEEDASDIPPDEVVDIAAKIKKSANLMFDLVSNLLDVNRIEQGKMEATLMPCDLWDTVRQSVETYRDRAQAKNIELHFDERSRAPLVMADGAQLVQVVDNLVSNAVKYSPPGKDIEVSVREQDGCVRAEIRDHGPGISAEDQKRLFGKFARLSAQPTGGEHSTGLGLAIVKRLVESMQGKVWCESELGKGAVFIVELQMASQAEQTPVRQ